MDPSISSTQSETWSVQYARPVRPNSSQSLVFFSFSLCLQRINSVSGDSWEVDRRAFARRIALISRSNRPLECEKQATNKEAWQSRLGLYVVRSTWYLIHNTYYWYVQCNKKLIFDEWSLVAENAALPEVVKRPTRTATAPFGSPPKHHHDVCSR